MLPESTPLHIFRTPVPVRLFAFVAAACTLAAVVLHHDTKHPSLETRLSAYDQPQP